MEPPPPTVLRTRLEGNVTTRPPHASPWRAILLGEDPGDLVESDLLFVLNEHDVDETFGTFREWGIAGIKHGFLQGGDQGSVAFVERMLRKTAEYRLLYNVHEAYAPTGVRRTYPHFLTREYVRSIGDGVPDRFIEPDAGGTEDFASPAYHVTMPFIQNVAGPVDAAPGLFALADVADGERKTVQARVPSTVTAQLARCLVVFSGLLHLPDHDRAYGAKADLFGGIDAFPRPLMWDESTVLDAEIGDYLAVARRRGDVWYLGIETDENARTIECRLPFLDTDRSYEATVYSDAPDAHYQRNPESYDVSTRRVTRDDALTAELAQGGGYAAVLRPL